MAIFSNPLFATYSVYACNASINSPPCYARILMKYPCLCSHSSPALYWMCCQFVSAMYTAHYCPIQ